MNKKRLSGTFLKEKILRTVDELPPMPHVMYEAKNVIHNPSSSVKDLAELIEIDQALAIKILRLSNSAYYRRLKKITSINEAAVVLGLKTLEEIITLAWASRLLDKTLKGYDLPARTLWQHSIAVAFGAKIIANKKFPGLSDEAYLAGLIHDVGKLILDKYLLERKETFYEFMADGQQTLISAEKKILGFDHAEIAAKICKKWTFPKSIAVAIKYHYYPSRSQGSTLAYIVHVSHRIAASSNFYQEGVTLDIDKSCLETVGIEDCDIQPIMNELVETVNKVTEKIKLH